MAYAGSLRGVLAALVSAWALAVTVLAAGAAIDVQHGSAVGSDDVPGAT